VDKEDEGIQHPDNHLMCYQVKLVGDKHDKRTDVTIANQFGDLRLDTTKEDELCVPSQKTHTGPPPDGPTGLLNDTGITWGGEYPSGNNADCTSTTTDIDQQDCANGRDAEAAAGTLVKVGGGAAGFDRTKLGADGTPLADQGGTWDGGGNEASGTQWSCVLDHVTGLWWEVKTNDSGLRDKDWTYTSYDSDYDNGDNPTSYSVPADAGTDGVWAGPVDTGPGVGSDNCDNLSDICTTEQYVNDVNAAGLCGKTDWRMPTIDELITLRHLGTYGPAIDTAYFPNTVSFYWSASPYAAYAGNAWNLNFNVGPDNALYRGTSLQVRLVRAGQ
jgi:hypothetical protein